MQKLIEEFLCLEESLRLSILNKLLEGTKLMADINQLKQDVADLKALVTSVGSDIDALIASVAGLKAQVAAGSPASQADLDSLDSGLQDLKTSLTADDAKGKPTP